MWGRWLVFQRRKRTEKWSYLFRKLSFLFPFSTISHFLHEFPLAAILTAMISFIIFPFLISHRRTAAPSAPINNCACAASRLEREVSSICQFKVSVSILRFFLSLSRSLSFTFSFTLLLDWICSFPNRLNDAMNNMFDLTLHTSAAERFFKKKDGAGGVGKELIIKEGSSCSFHFCCFLCWYFISGLGSDTWFHQPASKMGQRYSK